MYGDSPLSLIVPIVVITLVFITKRVTLSLFLGIVLAGVMMSYNDVFGIIKYIFSRIGGVFYEINEITPAINSLNPPNPLESSLDSLNPPLDSMPLESALESTPDSTLSPLESASNNAPITQATPATAITLKSNSFYVFGFLVILGILTQTVAHSGGISAFVKWARGKIKSARGSEFIAFIAGVIVFIDDYFNALTVGQISKSLNDTYQSTRERLAYIIDSTSAPICVLMPISSWGAYIMSILESKSIGENGAFLTLLSSVWYNYYAWFALLASFLAILWQVNFKAMRTQRNVGVKDRLEVSTHSSSSMWLLIAPIGILMISISAMIFLSGYWESGELELITMLQYTQTGFSLFWGGIIALLATIILSFRHLDTQSFYPIVKFGFLSILPAILILILAWAIGPVINDDMQTGIYLANLSQGFLDEKTLNFMPAIMFVIAGFIGFSTGTSWGTFAIMLPIASSLSFATNIDLTLCISAVLAGAVYGDHASPISDTTILSATGAGCSTQSHFITQLPYASLCALSAMIGFLVVGFSGVGILGYIIGGGLIISVFYVAKMRGDSGDFEGDSRDCIKSMDSTDSRDYMNHKADYKTIKKNNYEKL